MQHTTHSSVKRVTGKFNFFFLVHYLINMIDSTVLREPINVCIFQRVTRMHGGWVE